MAYENWMSPGWTKINDPLSTLSISQYSLSWNAVARGAPNSVIFYKDYGVGYFNADMHHRLEFLTCTYAQMQDGAWVYFWMLANMNEEPASIEAASQDYAAVYFVNATGDHPRFDLRLCANGTPTSDASVEILPSTRYYIDIYRDDDGGVNGTGRYTVYICTGNYKDLAGYALIDTLQLDANVGEQNDYRYMHSTTSRGATSSITTYGAVQNLDLVPANYEDAEVTISGAGSLTLNAHRDVQVSSVIGVVPDVASAPGGAGVGAILSTAGLFSVGAPSGIDNDDPATVSLIDGDGNTICSQTYNSGNAFPTNGYDALGGFTHQLSVESVVIARVLRDETVTLPEFWVVYTYTQDDDLKASAGRVAALP